jgi:hypothetical protein
LLRNLVGVAVTAVATIPAVLIVPAIITTVAVISAITIISIAIVISVAVTSSSIAIITIPISVLSILTPTPGILRLSGSARDHRNTKE